MDPDEVLRLLREDVEKLKASLRTGDSTRYVIGEAADGFIVKFEALDGWIKNGGFLPKDWQLK